MENEKLTKPQADLHLPEKEVSEHAKTARKSNILKSKFLIPLVIFLIIIAFLIGGVILLGKNGSSKQSPLGSLASLELGRSGPKPTVKTETSTPALDTRNLIIADSKANPGWKKYTNSVLGYSFEMSNTWKKQTFSTNTSLVSFTSPDYKITGEEFPESGSSIGINITKTSETDVVTYFNKNWNGPRGGPPTPKTTETQIDGVKALRYEINWEGDAISTIVVKNGYLYEIEIGFYNLDSDHQNWIKDSLPIYEKMLTTFKITELTQNQETFLEVPEFGVKFALSEDIKDAYVVTPKSGTKDFVYLKVHSLDNEPQCNSDESSTAALSKVGKDDINEMSGQKYSDSYDGVTVGNNFYYIDLAQYECAESPAGKAKLEGVRKAFSNASSTITSL